MLRSMYVKNFAIIDNISIEFNDKMTVLTGETGAGKSLIIDAIGLLFGDRASSEVVRTGETKATVEGVFDNLLDTNSFLEENDIEIDDYLIIKREINENGKSVCKINNTTVPLSLISELGLLLGNIHTQFDNEKLINPKNYLDFVDDEDIKKDLIIYSERLKLYNKVNREYKDLCNNEKENNQKLDFLKFQYNELQKANLSISEEEELKSKLNILNNYEKISSNLNSFIDIYDNDEVLDKIYESLSYLEKLASFDEKYNQYKNDLTDSYYNINDIVSSIKSSFKESDIDLNELDTINVRLGIYSDLKRKYKLQTNEIIDYFNSLKDTIDSVENFDEKVSELEKEVNNRKNELLEISNIITNKRIARCNYIEDKIKDNLVDLELKDTILEINVLSNPESFKKNGIDEIQINITFNKGEDLRPLNKIASGGELSRFMLALKAITSHQFENKTLIFDEIDSGVSGKIAYSIANKIKEISNFAQVLCVSHLVQVAAIATHQLFIAKVIKDDRTLTSIKELDYDGRVIELSKMASFGNLTDASISFAKELLKKE